MNWALPAVAVFAALLPGLAFYFKVRRGQWRSPVLFSTGPSALAIGFLTAIVFHIVWTALWDSAGLGGGLAAMAALALGPKHMGIEGLESIALGTAWYTLTVTAFAYGIGWWAHTWIRNAGIDHDADRPWRRFANPWHYLFTGELQQIYSPSEPPPAYTLVAVVIGHSDRDYLYIGTLSQWYFDRAGNLDRVVLDNVKRRPLKDDVQDPPPAGRGVQGLDERFYPLLGNFVVLKYAEIKTLNVSYLAYERVNSA